MKHTKWHNLCAVWDELHHSRLLWDISKLMCPSSANASVFIRTMLSTSTFPSSVRAFNNISVVFAVILPTFVSVVCKLDNLRSLPLVYRLRRPHISGFTFGVISRSQFIGRRYLPDFSFRFVSSSLLSHLKFTIFASFSDTFGAVFSVTVRDCAISSRVKNRFRHLHWFRPWSNCSCRRQL